MRALPAVLLAALPSLCAAGCVATHQEMKGQNPGQDDVKQTTYTGSTDAEKDASCCAACNAVDACDYWVRATDSNTCWLKDKFGSFQGSSSRRGAFKDGRGPTPPPPTPPPVTPPPAPPGKGGPCDIYDADGAPCVAAHALTRALYFSYSGPLYQVKRASDGTTKDITVVSKGGVADTAPQDAFCKGTSCTVMRIYDQSPQGNHLDLAPKGSACGGPDNPVNATRERLTVGGHPVYAAYFENHNGYRNVKTTGVATGDANEVMYMVTSGTHYNGGCCFDYGNAETDSHDDGKATMEAVYFGSAKGGLNHGGAGPGPWVMVDIENGLFGMDTANSNESSVRKPDGSQYDYVTAMAKGHSGNHFGLKAGDATSGKLTTYWDGNRPSGYTPMKKQGSIILGIGGDNSCRSTGTFYEGVMTIGMTSDAADDAVQANIVAAGYAK